MANESMCNISLKFLALVLLTLFLHVSALSQSIEKQDKIKDSLNKVVEKINEREKNGGIPVEFAGEFVELPDDLENSLVSAFPNHKFVVAKMNYFHWSWQSGVNLLLVTNDSDEIESFAWDLWFSGASESFRNILAQYQASSRKDALSKVEILSNLLTFAAKGRVGKVKMKNGTISSELFYKWSGNEKPWRVLRVPINKQFQFGRIAFINPIDGKEGSELKS